MDLPNLKDLKAILKLCRSQGVNKITLDSLAIEFGDMPTMIKGGERVAVPDEEDESVIVPTAEEMAFWSAAPDPLAGIDSGAQ
jgi:hypothetical protein